MAFKWSVPWGGMKKVTPILEGGDVGNRTDLLKGWTKESLMVLQSGKITNNNSTEVGITIELVTFVSLSYFPFTIVASINVW